MNDEDKIKLKEYKRQDVTCVCGTSMKRSSLVKHKKSQSHKDWAIWAEYEEPIPEGKIRCECGAIMLPRNVRRHNKNKHS